MTRAKHLSALTAGALAAGLLLVALLLAAGPARAAFPGGNGKIVFASDRDRDGGEIYTMDPDGTNVTPLTNNTVIDATPAFSPDGSRIVFQSTRDGNREIHVMDSDGQNPTRLTNNAAIDSDPAFSPDGSRIAFQSNRDGNREIYVMDAEDTDNDGNGENPTNLTNDAAFDSNPAFSPDGSDKIAFQSDRDGDEEVYVMDSDPNTNDTPDNLTDNLVFDGLPAFSPDGTKIAFVSSRDGNEEVYVMDSDGQNPTRLTNNAAIDSDPAFSPDGSRIAFQSNRDGNREIYVMDAEDTDNDGNGENPTRLTNNAAFDTDPDWGVDTTAPTVTGVTPANKATRVSPNNPNISATFSEPVKKGDVVTDQTAQTSSTVILLNMATGKRVGAKVSCDDDPCQVVTLTPKKLPLAKKTKFEVTVISVIEDLAGNALDQNPSQAGNQDKKWTFTTK